MPQVSIILPTHNRATTLARAISSVLIQTYSDFELIVVDDGSSDDTSVVLASFTDSRIRVLQKAHCEGAARARNDGIRAAQSEWLAFQDSDDQWLPHKLEQQLALRDVCGAEIGWIGGAYFVDHAETRRKVSSENLVRGSGYEIDLLIGQPFVTPTWLVRRECLFAAGLFDSSMLCLEDWDLIFKLSAVCGFRAVAEPVLVRYGSADSLYGDASKRKAGLDVILTRHRQLWRQDRRRYALWCAELGRLYGFFEETAHSRRWLREALRARVWQPGAITLFVASLLSGRLLHRLSRSRLATFTDRIQM